MNGNTSHPESFLSATAFFQEQVYQTYNLKWLFFSLADHTLSSLLGQAVTSPILLFFLVLILAQQCLQRLIFETFKQMYISTHFPSCFLSQHQCLIHGAVNGGEHSIDDVEGANDFYLIQALQSRRSSTLTFSLFRYPVSWLSGIVQKKCLLAHENNSVLFFLCLAYLLT